MNPVVQIGGGHNSTYNLSNFNFLAFNATSNVEFIEVEFVENITCNLAMGYEYRTNVAYTEKIDMSVDGNAAIFITATITETVDATSVTAINFLQGFTALEEIKNESIGYIIISLKVNFEEKITADVDGLGTYSLDTIYAENVDCAPITAIMLLAGFTNTEIVTADCYLTDDVNLKTAYEEVVTKDTSISQDVNLSVEFTENITGDLYITQDIVLSEVPLNELVTASVSVENIEESICYLDITLAPGQRLIIDSDQYNVYLDNENAVWIQRGDWIDELSRNTVNMEIIAASGTQNIQASILYTERFL